MSKVLLAFNGSLDSTLCIHWLKEHKDLEVVALMVDLGLEVELDDMAEQAILAGAASTHFEDLTESFCRDFVLPSLFANLSTMDNDPLATALGRPAIAKALVDIAREIGAEYVAHGCKPESDDNIRFDNYLAVLAPELKTIKPLCEWNLKTKEKKIDYARNHGLNFNFEGSLDEKSIDGNIWGHLVYRKSLDDPWTSANKKSFGFTTAPTETPSEPEQIIIEFRQGVPISLNNKKYSLFQLIRQLNLIGKKHGVGHLDAIGHKLNGLKTRKIIECPAATILTMAHQAIERLTMDRQLMEYKEQNVALYRKLVTFGYWYTQLREVLDTSFKSTQSYVTGEVRLELFHGDALVVGRRSPQALPFETGEPVVFGGPAFLRASTPFKKGKRQN